MLTNPSQPFSPLFHKKVPPKPLFEYNPRHQILHYTKMCISDLDTITLQSSDMRIVVQAHADKV